MCFFLCRLRGDQFIDERLQACARLELFTFEGLQLALQLLDLGAALRCLVSSSLRQARFQLPKQIEQALGGAFVGQIGRKCGHTFLPYADRLKCGKTYGNKNCDRVTNLNTTPYPTLDGLDVAKQRVLLRVDYNITLDAQGKLDDTWRMAASLPTLKRLLDGGARVGILTHRGRPHGRVVPELSTEHLAPLLSKMLGKKVEFVPDCIGRVAEHAMDKLAPGQAVLFENTRFHLGEQMNQMPFVKKLAALGDIFVNDAFATVHRAHASTSGLAAAMPVSVVGNLMLQELAWLHRVTDTPEHPLLLMLGGSNVGLKLELISHLLTRVDTLILGGAVAHTFLAARDLGLGQSMVDYACVDAARDILAEAGVVGCRLHLPKDLIVANKSDLDTPLGTRNIAEVAPDEVACDVGPETLATWKRVVSESATTAWMGSLGAFEHPAFATSTLTLAEQLTGQRGFSLLAGNGLLQALALRDLRDKLPAVSTGGGALMAALMGQPLPALAVLRGRNRGWVGTERRGQ